jgi:arylsulfatase A
VHQGFDEFKGFLSGNVDYHSHIDEVGNADWWQGDTIKSQAGYTTNLITQNAIDFITRHKNQPFFLYIAHEAPHYPYQGLNSKADRDVKKVGKTKGSAEDILPIYKEMIEVMDADIGKTLKALKDLKLDSNTVVIFCSDNGGVGEVNSNGVLRGTKTNLWEGGHRVPAIAQWTGHLKPNTISKETVLGMDLFPTFLEMAGIAKSKEIDGISIAKHLQSQQALPERTVFWGYGVNSTAVRKGKWKLLELNADTKAELYDLEADISEKTNLADKHPDIVKALKDEITVWKADVYKDK